MSLRDSGAALLGGLRLSLLRAPRRTPLTLGFGTFALLVLLAGALGLSWQWLLVDAPRAVNMYGVQWLMTTALVVLAISALICAICDRRALFWTVAAWLQASMLLPSAVLGIVIAIWQWNAVVSPWLWGGLLAWVGAVLLRTAWFVSHGRARRALPAAALAGVLWLLPWKLVAPQLLWDTDWEAYAAENAGSDAEMSVPGELADPEAVMYGLGERLNAAVAQLAPQRPGVIDMYVLAFGGDASENVFRNEVDYIGELFPRRFDARSQVLSLINHPDTAATQPQANATNLERGLAAIGARMDPEEDILFAYLTSHGSAEHELYVNQPPLAFDQLTPQRLRAALDASGIRWRVIVVSACYSGGFIHALRDPQTLVITAARADRTSFGCGAESDITWFGHAFIAEALNETSDLREAFDIASAKIAEREKAQDFEPSQPQWVAGDRIMAQLARWRAAVLLGDAVPFEPTMPATADADEDADDERAEEAPSASGE